MTSTDKNISNVSLAAPAEAGAASDTFDTLSVGNTPADKRGRALESPARVYRLKFVFLVVLLVCVLFAALCIGRYMVSPGDMVNILSASLFDWCWKVCAFWAGLFGIEMPIEPDYYAGLDMSAVTAVQQVRWPRVIVCAFVGAALSIAGAAYQGVFQNPMVSQDVLGASSGAAFGAALAILLGASGAGVTAYSFAFGILAVVIAYGVSRISPATPILALILSGMVVSALFSSGTSCIKLVADTESALPAITYWLMGSMASIRLREVVPCVLAIIVTCVPLVLLRWRINLLATGEEEAKSFGLNTHAMRIVIIGCSTLLTAICVSVSGLIGWVGLVIPHFCRLMLGHDYRRIVPASLVMGAAFLTLVDLICRVATTSEIPIGILTAFVGAPVFIFLIAKGGAHGKA